MTFGRCHWISNHDYIEFVLLLEAELVNVKVILMEWGFLNGSRGNNQALINVLCLEKKTGWHFLIAIN